MTPEYPNEPRGEDRNVQLEKSNKAFDGRDSSHIKLARQYNMCVLENILLVQEVPGAATLHAKTSATFEPTAAF